MTLNFVENVSPETVHIIVLAVLIRGQYLHFLLVQMLELMIAFGIKPKELLFLGAVGPFGPISLVEALAWIST